MITADRFLCKRPGLVLKVDLGLRTQSLVIKYNLTLDLKIHACVSKPRRRILVGEEIGTFGKFLQTHFL